MSAAMSIPVGVVLALVLWALSLLVGRHRARIGAQALARAAAEKSIALILDGQTERERARLRWSWFERDSELPWPPTTVESFAEFAKIFGAPLALAPRETSAERDLRRRVERRQAQIADGWAEMFHTLDPAVWGGVR